MTEPQCFNWFITYLHPTWKFVFKDDGQIKVKADDE